MATASLTERKGREASTVAGVSGVGAAMADNEGQDFLTCHSLVELCIFFYLVGYLRERERERVAFDGRISIVSSLV